MLRPVHSLLALAILLGAGIPTLATADAPPATFQVGFGIRDITPAPELGAVNLGGFGFGCCRPAQGHEYPVRVRAMVIGDGERNVALASVEVQGTFAAYADGAFGQYDVAKAVESATGGALPRDHIIVSSDHSHRGADTTGVWGGLAPSYMAFIAKQTEGAILDAYAARAESRIRVAEINASSYVSSDFDSANQDTPDGWFRVLFVETPTGDLAGVYGTFSAHATLHGSPAFLSPDWPGIVSDKVSAAAGGVPVVLGQGAVGRTHPATDRATWEDRITAEIMAARGAAAFVTASGVDGAEAAITLNAYNAILLSGLTTGKLGCGLPANPVSEGFQDAGINPLCYPIARAALPPWQTGNRLTTLVSAVRVGDVLVWGAPGEIYPNAQWVIQASVAAPHVFVAGLANDQVGYLIAPSEDWHKIASTPTSDNTLFNVDVTGGDHVVCAVIDLADELGFVVSDISARPPICLTWVGEDRTLPP